MKKLSAGLLAGLLLTTSLPALADRHDWRHERRFGPERHGHYERHARREGRRDAAWGVLGAGLVLGAIALAAEPYRPPPPPVVVVPARPAQGMWYYCTSAGAYYPYTQYCPEGWRAVPAY